MEQLLTTRDVADRLRVTPETVRHLAARGVLRSIRFAPRGSLRFSPADVDEALERARQA